MTLALICAGLLAASPATDPPDMTKAYQEARAGAGKSSEEQVRLALWCEAHGLTRERLNHLALAVLSDPANATARGLMGLVAYNGRFQRPEAVAAKAQADPVLAEYDAKRMKAPYTADGQWAMGVWAEERGLKDQARAHLTAVIRLDPARESAWKRLGYRKHEGRWITDAQVAAQKADAEAQKQADRKWKSLLEKCKAMLDQPSKRQEAEQALAAVSDPRAVPSIGRVFLTGRPSDQSRAVQLLGQVDSPAASRMLAALAVFSGAPEIRRGAVETLRRRDPREFADLLIALLREPIKYEVRPVGGPGSPGALFVQGQRFNVQRLYSPPAPAPVALRPGDYLGTDDYGLPVIHRPGGTHVAFSGRIPADQLLADIQSTTLPGGVMSSGVSPQFLAELKNPSLGPVGSYLANLADPRGIPQPTPQGQQLASEIGRVGKAEHKAPSQFGFGISTQVTTEYQIPVGQMMVEAQKTAMAAQQQLASDVAALEAEKRAVRQRNERVAPILASVAGKDLGQNPEAWKAWWVNQLGYTFKITGESPRPTVVEDVPLAYQPQPIPVSQVVTSFSQGFTRMSCFGAGTAVQTITGSRAIETLRAGDRVLTQSTATGALGYQPILVVHHNPPSPTFLIKVAGDTIVSSPFHRFWKAGKGWVMARDLRAGDRLRLLEGVAEVTAVEEGNVQLVYNLDVAEDADFFAGTAAALVHDNTLPDPRLAPFDAATVAVARRGESDK